MKLKNLLILAVPALFWAACSSDSDSSPAVPPVSNEASSDSTGAPPDPTPDPLDPALESSSSIGELVTSSDAASVPAVPDIPFVPEELVYDSIGFADIGNAYRTVAPDEKVVFVVRHAERESGVGHETPLTENGVLQAQSVGLKLASADEFVYAHTAYEIGRAHV